MPAVSATVYFVNSDGASPTPDHHHEIGRCCVAGSLGSHIGSKPKKQQGAIALLSRGSFVFGPRVVAPCPALHSRIFLNFNMQACIIRSVLFLPLGKRNPQRCWISSGIICHSGPETKVWLLEGGGWGGVGWGDAPFLSLKAVFI